MGFSATGWRLFGAGRWPELVAVSVAVHSQAALTAGAMFRRGAQPWAVLRARSLKRGRTTGGRRDDTLVPKCAAREERENGKNEGWFLALHSHLALVAVERTAWRWKGHQNFFCYIRKFSRRYTAGSIRLTFTCYLLNVPARHVSYYLCRHS